MADVISSIAAEYRRYKGLGEAAIAQLSDAELARPSVGDSNSIVVIVRHIDVERGRASALAGTPPAS